MESSRRNKLGGEERPALGENFPTMQNRHILRIHGNFGALADVSDIHALDELSISVITKTGENKSVRACKPTTVKSDEIRCELNRKGLVEGAEYPVVIQVSR